MRCVGSVTVLASCCVFVLWQNTPSDEQPTKSVAPKTLAYDGFAAGMTARSYLSRLLPTDAGAPVAGTIGFNKKHGWLGKSDTLVVRDGMIRRLTHPLLTRTQYGSLGHWKFNGARCVRRKLAKAPVAKTGIVTLCLLYRAHDNRRTNLPATNNHTTNFPGAHGMIGFTPVEESKGKRGLSLGYFEDDLRVFVGGKSFTLVQGYKEGTTYLLRAEMTLGKNGPEYVRGYVSVDKERTWTPAAFNKDNNGKGVKIETWSSPDDLAEMETYFSDAKLPASFGEASPLDLQQHDHITWDEVHLLDGSVTKHIPADPRMAIVVPKRREADLLAHWPFDEGRGKTIKDTVGKHHLQLKNAKFTRHHRHGTTALEFDDRGRSGMASLSFDEAEKAGLTFDSDHKFTISAWVRGRGDGSWGGVNDIVTMCRSGQARYGLFDKRGFAFSLVRYRLRLSLIDAIHAPLKDSRLEVTSSRTVPDNAAFHHVAVTYDGSRKTSGVVFYVNGVKDREVSLTTEKAGHKLKGHVAVACAFNIGGRNDDQKDRFRFGFSGYIDEVGVFGRTLNEGEVAAIVSLGTHRKLTYNLKQVASLIALHNKGTGQVKIGPHTWQAVDAGSLKSGVGEVEERDGVFAVRLTAAGSGLRTRK